MESQTELHRSQNWTACSLGRLKSFTIAFTSSVRIDRHEYIDDHQYVKRRAGVSRPLTGLSPLGNPTARGGRR